MPPKGEDSGVSGRGPSGISGAFGLMENGGGFCAPALFGCTRGAFSVGWDGVGAGTFRGGNGVVVVVVVVVLSPPPPNHRLKKPDFFVVCSSGGAGVISISVL